MTEPCGTPNVSMEVLDLKPLIGTSCFYDIDKFQTFFFFFLQHHTYHNDQALSWLYSFSRNKTPVY